MKKNLLTVLSSFTLAVLFLLSFVVSYSNEPTLNTRYFGKSFTLPEISYVPSYLSSVNNTNLYLQGPSSQIEFYILDSLANAYSYFTESQQPFVYIPSFNQLITIKRGYWDHDRFQWYTGDNNKNNLFIRYSTDWGKNWTEPELVYKVNPGLYGNWWARYPSIYAFQYLDDIAYVFTSPATNGSGWVGFINGLYYQGTSFPTFSGLFTWKDGNNYNWGGTDSRILGGVDSEDNPYTIAVGSIMIEGGLPLTLTSHLGYRYTTDFDTWEPVIPEQWQASVFRTPSSTDPTADSLRTSVIAGFKFGTDGKMYLGAYANFANSQLNRFTFGVSVSEDLGKTWSDFEIMPPEILDNYLADYGLNIDLVTWQVPQFVPFDQNNYSFMTAIFEDTTKTLRLWDNALHQLIEVYKENGVWGVRKVADISGFVLAYLPSGTSNQMGEEAQLSRTVDGTKLVAKWVDFTNVVINDTLYRFHDIFVAVREVGDQRWSVGKNITSSPDFDRITWIPDLLPNDLKDVPIIKLVSIPIPGQDPAEAAFRQRTLDTVPQYVVIGYFNADDIIGIYGSVDSETQSDNRFEVKNLYPTPCSEKIWVEFSSDDDVDLTIDVYNILGEKIKTAFSEKIVSTDRFVQISVADLPVGNYLVLFKTKSQTITKSISVIR